MRYNLELSSHLFLNLFDIVMIVMTAMNEGSNFFSLGSIIGLTESRYIVSFTSFLVRLLKSFIYKILLLFSKLSQKCLDNIKYNKMKF
ncbi:MAG TPA: hypothetical protein VLA48_08930, partial [Nitrososphaeraceae archaeon]|nr:hypothetical protein [Nitrososphaeraceae archaeon]